MVQPLYIKVDYPKRRCDMCNVVFKPVRGDQRFHSEPCRLHWNSVAASRGRALYDLAVKWRRSRGKKGTLSDMGKMIDNWLDEDRNPGGTKLYKRDLISGGN